MKEQAREMSNTAPVGTGNGDGTGKSEWIPKNRPSRFLYLLVGLLLSSPTLPLFFVLFVGKRLGKKWRRARARGA
jgi:hypothetical protein